MGYMDEKGGWDNYTRAERKAYNAKYYKVNRAKLLEAAKERKREDPEHYKEYNATYYASHKEELKVKRERGN